MPKSSKRKHETRRANRDRKQRLEDLRSQQKAAERRKNWLFAGSAIVVALILIGAAVIPAYIHDRNKKAKEKEGYQAAPTAAEKAASCTGVHNDPVSPPATHVPNEPIDYTKNQYGDDRDGAVPIPPSGGPHNPVPLGVAQTRFFGLDVKARPERAVHNLEHGFVVAWYDKKLPKSDVDELETLAKDQSLDQLLVVGWTAGELPLGKHMVLTSWGRTDRCGSVSADVVKEFYDKHANELAPEVGSGTMNGDQFAPDDLNTTQPATASPGASGSPGASASTSPSTEPSKK